MTAAQSDVASKTRQHFWMPLDYAAKIYPAVQNKELTAVFRLTCVFKDHHLTLLSPWLDMTLSIPAIKEIDRFDPLLNVEGFRKAGVVYARRADPTSFMLSPVNGDLEELGKISIFIGSRDILAADARN